MIGKGGFARCFKVTKVEDGAVYVVKVTEKKSVVRDR